MIWTIRMAEPWTAANLAGGILLLAAAVAAIVWAVRVTLHR